MFHIRQSVVKGLRNRCYSNLVKQYDTLVDSKKLIYNEHQEFVLQSSQRFVDNVNDHIHMKKPVPEPGNENFRLVFEKDMELKEADFDAKRAAFWERAIYFTFYRGRKIKSIKKLVEDVQYTKSIWVYGPSNSGRAQMINMTFDAIHKDVRKIRYRFPEFLEKIHEINKEILDPATVQDEVDPIPMLVKEIADSTDVLFLDDFEISNVTDAMIMRRLFLGLFAEGIPFYATAWRPPEMLLQQSEQQRKLKPFIRLLKRQCNTFELFPFRR